MPVRYRWAIAVMLAAASLINYLDRQTLALMASVVQQDLAIDDPGYALVVNAFLVAYMIGAPLGAIILDRIGARRSMMLFIGWWSLASAFSGLATNMWQLAATRFALGLGEAANWIASPKLVREWFPRRERALAIGIYSGAAHFGAAVAPFLITSLMIAIGWRMTFLLSGVIGLVWLVVWRLGYRPDMRPPVFAEDAENEPRADQGDAADAGWQGWGRVLRSRALWCYAIASSLTNPVWFFYLFWFPKYLVEERGMTVAEMGATSWVVYAAAAFGSVSGGLTSDALVRRGVRPARARVYAMGMVALVAPLGALNALEPSVTISLALGAVVAFCHTAWVTNQTALPVDLFPQSLLAKVMGAGSILTGLVTIGSTYLVGQLVGEISYRPMFLVIAVAYPLGVIAAYFSTVGKPLVDREALA